MQHRMDRGAFAGFGRIGAGGKSLSMGPAMAVLVFVLVFSAVRLSAEENASPDAQACVESRYGDSRWMEYIHSSDSEEGMELLRQTCRLIAQRHYPAPEAGAVLEGGLEQLEAAAKNPLIGHPQNGLEANRLTALQEEIRQIRTELEFRKDLLQRENLEEEALRIAKHLEPFTVRAGLETSWPAMELSGALASSLDPYSHVLSPSQYQALEARLKGSYAGIGVDLTIGNGWPVIHDVLPDGPAGRAGLKPGGVIVQLNERGTHDLNFAQIQELMSGARGSRISLTVEYGGRSADYTLCRESVGGITVRYIQRLSGTHTGFLRISSFDGDTAMELRRGLNALEGLSVTSLIVDLRDNGGGVMTSAIDAAGLFVSEGLITAVESRAGESEYRSEANGIPVCVLPMAVLVNEKTASAAEIFAAALQDHQRAIVLGRRTMGKTQVQTLYPLNRSRAALCLTTGRYVRPNPERRAARQVEPDIRIERESSAVYTMEYYLTERDRELNRALRALETESKDLLAGNF